MLRRSVEITGAKRPFNLLEIPDSDFHFRPRLCKNSPNFVADGTAFHIDYKSPSAETLISYFGIGKAREPLQFTTSSFHFAFLHSLGQMRTSVSE